ncbi:MULTISPECIES: alpha/beta hydrolase [unclassified Legionella]|uniref:alpha/beta hydrolase n=1 Tax=unclassified Legionella TaxID=2622702 RepID=UPI001F5E71C9|nr:MULTISPECIES: alpha/beta hydrolase [unclassified Legionella]MDI9819516.1 alpha/beta hydrolase [Legionella sp. PL877]
MPSRQIFAAEDMEQIIIPTLDGLKLHSWYKPAAANKPTILYLHGNAGHIGYRMPLAREFITAGFGVLLLEYRGYGGNQGQPSEKGLYLDGRAAMQYLQQQGIVPSRTVLYGESLGTGVAIYLANLTPVCAVVLQSPYTSMASVARYHYPWVFIAPWDKFDSLSLIADIHSPLLLLHGINDRIIPYNQSVTLLARANEPKELIGFPHRGHNDLWSKDFADKILEFLNTHCH